MTPERWQQVRDVLEKALELVPSERSAFLNSACSSDQSLRQEVETLLASSDGVRSGFLQSSTLRVTLISGAKLGDYEVKSLLGSGGMGEVYRARDSRLGRDVAIKVLPSFLSADSDRLRRFEQEARAAATLNHPNILAVHQMGTCQGAPYLVSELLEGETLREQLNRGRLAVRKAIDYGVQIARGLAAAHEKGIVHRDLKPENLFVTKDGRVKILDFGLAKLTQPQSGPENAELTLTKETEVGMVMGTVGYMSPEQVRGQTADHRADIFAFGAILYEMLAGIRAFQKPTSAETMTAILNEDPSRISQVTTNIPPALQRVVHRCLEKSPEQRFQSASDLAFALDALSGNAGSATVYPGRDGAKTGLPATITGGTARWRLLAVGGAFLVLLSGIGIWRYSRKYPESPTPAFEVVPLVAMEGKQRDPAFSPDGNQVAFLHLGPNTGGIYTTLIDGEKPLRLTDNPRDAYPTWSPDSRQIAFTRYSEEGRNIYVVPALGGTEHKLYTTPGAYAINGYLNWAPDGRVLAFSEGNADSYSSRIALLSLADLTTRPLTSPPFDKADMVPAFSPDGSTVAFIRISAPGWRGDLFVLPAKGGEPRQLTFDNSWIFGLTWTKDGGDIVFSSSRGGVPTLWRISASGGTPRPVQGVGSPADHPSISGTGDRLVYGQSSDSDNIWRSDLKDKQSAKGPPVRVTSISRGLNWRPNFSPDGKKIVFESDRLGYSDIWYCDSDGSNCAQLTSLHGAAGTARVSPDGHYVAFEFRGPEHEEIYVVEVPSGRPRLVPTFPGADDGAPNWSRDGQWIYFYSDHEGRPYQLWKMPFKGGPPVRVTKNGGVYAIESDDGRFLYYSKITEPGIWKMQVEGGEEVRVLDRPSGQRWFSWAVTRDGIYFLDEDPPNGKIKFFDFVTGKTISILALGKEVPFFSGLAVSLDGKSLLFVQRESSDSFIMLVKNFR